MDAIQKNLLEQVAGLHEVPQGAYSLRINGALHGKNSSENIVESSSLNSFIGSLMRACLLYWNPYCPNSILENILL